MTTTNTGSYSRIRYFTSLLERMGEASRGGRANTISNAYSSILGGSGNTVSHSHAAAFGSGVSSVATNTFHVECLNACATPLLGFALPWTLSYLIATPGMVSAGFPVGSKVAMIG
jgi:hypothetical protein